MQSATYITLYRFHLQSVGDYLFEVIGCGRARGSPQAVQVLWLYRQRLKPLHQRLRQPSVSVADDRPQAKQIMAGSGNIAEIDSNGPEGKGVTLRCIPIFRQTYIPWTK